jgi:AhpD family alkylhydroperoxidase
MRERIALLTAAVNDCGYCVSAHNFRGVKLGMTTTELADTQVSHFEDPKCRAALKFVEV